MYAYGYRFEPKTPSGLRWCMVSFVIYIIMLIVQMILAIWMWVLIANFQSGSSISDIFSSLIITLTSLVLVFILGLIVLIIFFVGFYYLYSGRKEFLEPHGRNLWIAVLLILGAVVAYVVGTIMVAIINIGSLFSFTSPNYDYLYNQVLAGIIVNTIVAAFVATTLVLSVRALALPQHNIFLYSAAGLGSATPAIVGTVSFVLLSQLIETLQSGTGTLAGVDVYIGLPSIIGSFLGILTFILFLQVYYIVYKRIKTGELKPMMPPPIPITWVPSPYAPPVPAQPIYPPPTQPPPQPPTQPPPQQPLEPEEPS